MDRVAAGGRAAAGGRVAAEDRAAPEEGMLVGVGKLQAGLAGRGKVVAGNRSAGEGLLLRG